MENEEKTIEENVVTSAAPVQKRDALTDLIADLSDDICVTFLRTASAASEAMEAREVPQQDIRAALKAYAESMKSARCAG